MPSPFASSSAPPAPLKLGVWSAVGSTAFIDPLLARLPPRYEVVHMGRGATEKEIQWGLNAVDAALFEWAMGPAAGGARLGTRLPVIVRLLRYEAYTDWPRRIDWQNVDDLVLPSEGTRHALFDLYGDALLGEKTRLHVVPTGVDLAAHPLDPQKPRTPEVLCVGSLHYARNPALLVQLVGALVQRDPRHVLHVVGHPEQQAFDRYLRYHVLQLGLAEHVVFHGPLGAEALHAVMNRCSYVVTTGLMEEHPVEVVVGMARGLRPVVHDFYGARDVFPPECVWGLVDEAVAQIASGEVQPAAYRRFVEARYALDDQVARMVGLLDRAVAHYQPGRIARLLAVATKRPEEVAQNTFLEAQMHVQAGRLADAIVLFSSLDFGRLPEALWLRGRVMALQVALQLGAPEEALRHAKAASKLAPEEPLVLNLAGRALWMAGRGAAARNKFMRAAEFSTATHATLPFDADQLRRDAAEACAALVVGNRVPSFARSAPARP